MAQPVRDVMTPNPVILEATAMVVEAAQQMRDEDVGDVLVQDDGKLCGIVTDRDIVVRCVAEAEDPSTCTLGDLCTEALVTIEAESSLDEAVILMKRHAVRRVPVMEAGRVVGIVSLGDLAIARDPDSALGQISAAASTH
jgi:CBS domain-containing protein